MGRWILVHGLTDGERILVNLDNVDTIQGQTIFFMGDDEDYLVVSESFDDLIKLIANAEAAKIITERQA